MHVVIVYRDLQVVGQICLEMIKQDMDMETQINAYLYALQRKHARAILET